jgi:DNA-binding NtrC family response regulator
MRIRNILLIDDNKNELTSFTQALQNLNASSVYDCIYANSARQGLRILECIIPHTVFIDMNMPRANGLDCLEMIKKRLPGIKARIILYSKTINDVIVKTALEMGAADFIKKPKDIPELEQLLQGLLLSRDR